MAATDKPRQNTNGTEQRRSTSFERCIYAPHSIAAIVAELAEQSIEPGAVLEGTNLVQSQLDSHTTKVSYRQIDLVVQRALKLTSDPAIALRAGERMHVTAYGMYGYALLSSATNDEARDFAARYIRVVGPFCDFRVAAETSEAMAFVIEPLHWPDPADDRHRFAVEFALSAHLTATRDHVGSDFAFSRVMLDYPAPSYAEDYDRLFACPVQFDQRACGYEHEHGEFPRRRLADPRTHAMAREMCEQLLEEVNQAGGVASDIRRILIEQPGRYPSIEAIAEKLEMYPRALRRKLEAEGTSYRDILAEVRMRLAIEYLRKTQMTNEEIAGRLGYSDAANFRHAFMRWTGKNPSDFRNAARQ
ncbi:MAG: AraC family transcriptional regulator [Xanthobacteraceae bacterium]|nr:AraC family transcriptional regulator [Xanthobacteraceae bacterium]